MSARLSRRNEVRGTGGRWVYGLRVRDSIGSVSFDVVRLADRETIALRGLSPYRTTALARRMRDGRLGYETEARRAIRNLENRES